ncbi:MAG: hypothetical protein NC132_04175 [Corallococcus sp.]|nr:hypothetical protein [Corallococcus sp.]MCM1359856.1 hypothetical protein [Corallococcus sp.]MCM1395290.1 hypothetical protein [Corallococcus sp.]
MSNLLLFGDVDGVGEIIAFSAVLLFTFIVVVLAAVFCVRAAKRRTARERQQMEATVKSFQDAAAKKQNADMRQKNERIEKLRSNSPQETTHSHIGDRIVSNSDGHTHVAGEEELYDKIVGSLGDVSDEGCNDLDGVRFIVDDIAYQSKSQSADYTAIAKAIVMGDVINNPRFKSGFRKK